MCGIVGWIDWEADLSQQGPILAAMVETLTHRGPDASGTWISPQALIGHRRLSVVDLTGGVQPMIREVGGRRYVLTYNGELYNTPELRRELEARGHRFRTRCDTEAVLLAYIEWGDDCVQKFNGIYAFGVWDEVKGRLFLARDRMGVKPLFYARRGSAFLFASEIKALLVHPGIRPELDAEGLAEVFAIGPARTPGHGVFKGIQEVRPGYALTIDETSMQVNPYWTLQSRPHEDSLEETTERVRELLLDAIERQLVSDVPVCTLLSGGLDSSTLTAVAAHVYERDGLGPLDTYSIDYRDNDIYFKPSLFQPNADAPWIQRVSQHLGTIHHEVIVDTPELVDALKPALWARDLPGMVDVESSLYLFCREIKKGATVALSGECADEVFGGYPWFHRPELLNAGVFPWARRIAERASLLAPAIREYIQPETYVARRYEETLAEVPRLPGEDAEEARRREMFYLNITWFMTTLLDRKDRMSMAHGLEVRVPFCDHRIVEYVWNIPWAMKTCEGREKGILRRALRGILPEDVLWRKKSPYPKTHNPAYTTAVRHWLVSILDDPDSPLLSLIDEERVRALTAADAETTDLPWFGQLMGLPQLFAYLAQVDLWLRNMQVSIG
ncbi:asparagine synthase (glutamine-hydrolyzing) [Heliobacterium gestii]|uniref:asparagine synthase (glutamine-hydrolyzing) n=1 Tax=Heliomicrobium gestii TaxID=2699 RepID=A0A845L5Y6_HELGE|nr:asparagine synthase (glutamine-hydrolyzing) [Heliomicrobium gestii]MBM7865357.1 asparagine synthase (glutamine-hydrolyzing) [Heliomicrobium gestii]MZP41618.1 asparagine synthase (glutamine-hydrolyzing) [Heliomicrobium gestii]